ncbi:tetratricopeptide repeat protein 39A-like [Oppia nitens]|uniref:tetratricopeptide repeat protein 39A-like n=1 Tax=Oppia nitens TaxID=1686743 RepID=UPI0023DC5266|nr:tetratricopeptide repeat protein 39A-like [Oppia nitens]
MNLNNNNNNKSNELPTIEESIRLATLALETAIETNGLETSIQMLDPFADKCLYHSSLRSIIIILNAGLTLQKHDLDRATQSWAQTAQLSNRYRRTGLISDLVKLFKTPDYNKYSDMEVHAELTHAKFLGLSALLGALEAQNIYALIKIAYRLRLCVNAFRECKVILRSKTNWESELSRQNFEAGVRLANGIQHLMISHIPPKLLRIVNFLGYKGVESRALQELTKTAFELPGLSARIAQVVLLVYWIVGQSHGCLGPKDLTLSQQIIDKELKRFPKSLLYKILNAKLAQVSGHIDEAIQLFKDCLVGNDLVVTHKLFHIELSFSYALKCQWDECIKYAELVRQQAIHSPAIITYILAIFKFAKAVDDNDQQMKKEANQLFESIPDMRIRYFGKTITPEKVAVELSLKYVRNNHFLPLPELDTLYGSNHLYFLKNNPIYLDRHLQRVDKYISIFKKDFDEGNGVDSYVSALFYKAFLLKLKGHYEEAKQCLNIILNEEQNIEKNSSILPQTTLEMGLIQLSTNNSEEAKNWLKKTMRDYNRYLNENYVHLRIYAALRELGISTDKQSANQNQINQFGKQWLKDLEVEEKSYENILKTDNMVLSIN